MQYLLANGESMRIREALPEDAPALLKMDRKVAGETNFLLITAEETDLIPLHQKEQLIGKFHGSADSLLLIAITKEEIVGCLSLEQKYGIRQKHVGEFEIAVLSAYWNMGIARRMMNHMMKWVVQNPSIRSMQLKVMANNEKAIRLFRKFGFREEGRQHRTVRLNNELYVDVITMGQWLKKSGTK